MAKKTRFTGFDKTLSPYFKTVPNEKVPWRLQSVDGKYFGDVSWEAYKAVEEFKLDSYKPKDQKEKTILDNYRKHKGIPLTTENGVEFGNVSYDAYMALSKGNFENYKPKDSKEKKHT